MDAYHILVIILAGTLAVFLVLAIVTTVLVIDLIKKISRGIDTAQHAVENVEAVTHSIKNVADGTLVTMLAGKLWERVSKSKAKKGRTHNG